MEIDNAFTITSSSQYIPVAFDQEKGIVQWLYAGTKDFDEPFFEDTMRMMKHAVPEQFTSLQKLIDIGKNSKHHTIKPTAFIFHTSRCGSTLTTQMLARTERNIVYSEPPLLDDILCADIPDNHKVEALRAAIILMGQKRKAIHEYLFIKWDCWHLAYFELIRYAFPKVDTIFLYREPLGVLKSHQRSRGMHMVPGLLKKDVFQIRDIPACDLDQYAAGVLLKLYEWMINHSMTGNVRLVNYTDLADHLFDIITDLGLSYTQKELDAMLERSKKHSKHLIGEINQRPFGEEKFKRLEELAEPLKALYERLELIKNDGLRTPVNYS